MHIAHTHAHGIEILRERFRHALGERGGKRAVAAGSHLLHLAEEVVDLPLHRAHADLRVDQPRRADDLLHRLAGKAKLIVSRRGGNADELVDARVELLKAQRPVVERRRQAKAVFHKVLLA